MTEKEEASTSDIASFAFTRKKIKYSILDDVVPDSMLGTTVSVFIDMRYLMDILKIEYYRTAVEQNMVRDSNRVISEFLGFIVHYRRYFVAKRNCRTEFVLMYDDGGTDEIKLAANPEYGSKRAKKTVKPGFMKFVGDKIRRIAPCIPDMKVVYTGSAELSCVPFVVRDLMKSKYNVFITDDPLMHMASTFLPNFVGLRPNGANSRAIGKNGFFRHVYEKNKWSASSEDDLRIDDSYIRLYLNLTGGDDDCPVGGMKNKKAANLINSIKLLEPKFVDYEAAVARLGTPEVGRALEERDVCYNPEAHAASLGEAVRIEIARQYSEPNRPSRDEFSHYNREYFNNSVDETTLFLK